MAPDVSNTIKSKPSNPHLRKQSGGSSSAETLVNNDSSPTSSSPGSPPHSVLRHSASRRSLHGKSDHDHSSPSDSEFSSSVNTPPVSRRPTRKSSIELGALWNKVKSSSRRGSSQHGGSEESENDAASIISSSSRSSKRKSEHSLYVSTSPATGTYPASGHESTDGNFSDSFASFGLPNADGAQSEAFTASTASKKDRKLFRRSLSIRSSVSREKLVPDDGDLTPTTATGPGTADGSASELPALSDSAIRPSSPAPSQFFRKKNKEVHRYFKSLPESENYIDDYGCALQKDILIQGRLYLTDHHFCFYANIFGFVTTLLIPIHQVVSLDKKMTAKIFPNAIAVSTEKTKYLFASFLVRDAAYTKMHALWRHHVSHLNPHTNNINANSTASETEDMPDVLPKHSPLISSTLSQRRGSGAGASSGSGMQ
ncbi:hypothetical protein HK102_009782, partial [Quaeritorhiza haematococci]